MVGTYGEVLVLDWGLAVSLPQANGQASHAPNAATARLGGTPAYMAPEMARGQQAQLAPASDVYLLGAILFQILTGKAHIRARE